MLETVNFMGKESYPKKCPRCSGSRLFWVRWGNYNEQGELYCPMCSRSFDKDSNPLGRLDPVKAGVKLHGGGARHNKELWR